jgi:hypothetical protein
VNRRAPYGGLKQSGIGRKASIEGVLEYLQMQTVTTHGEFAWSSGEAEFVLYQLDDGLWLGLGSDHTDRKAETVDVTLSKQMCARPVGSTL